MNRITWTSVISIILCTLGVAIGFFAVHREFWMAAIIILGIVWLVAFNRRWNLIFNFAFVFFVILNGYLTYKGFIPELILLFVVTALVAFDLNGMISRFEKLGHEVIDQTIETAHLKRLTIILGVGLVIGEIALSFHIHFSLAIGLVLALLVFIGFSQLILHLRRSNESNSKAQD